MQFDRAKFWAAYRRQFGSIQQTEIAPVELVLGYIEQDASIELVEWAAYLLATIRKEVGHNFTPIREIKDGSGGTIWRKYQSKYWNTGFFGRGYVQLTWRDNYATFDKLLGMGGRLLSNPDLALQHETAYKILAIGCVKGLFRKGFSLSKMLPKGVKPNYLAARQIVNGIGTKEAHQWAVELADYAERYEICLRFALR